MKSTMTYTKQLAFAYMAGAATAFLAILFFYSAVTHAEAPAGLASTVATTSQIAVTPTASLVIATSSCNARIISTTASPIMIGFTDNQGFVPTALVGFLQPASTTVSYDAGMYGCGAVRIYSFVNSSITVADSR